MLPEHVFTTTVGGKEITFKTGKLAEQAGGAIVTQLGDNMLLTTATMSKSAREGLDFFPLSVDYEEKMYAAGRIPGSFFRREGRPTTDAILTCALDGSAVTAVIPRRHAQRGAGDYHHPLLGQHPPLDIMAVNSASAAIMISDIPWNGPIGAVRVAYIDGQLVANPTIPEMENSSLDLRWPPPARPSSWSKPGPTKSVKTSLSRRWNLATRPFSP
jgi:polyribonucleotide nucleotidyltransferase